MGRGKGNRAVESIGKPSHRPSLEQQRSTEVVYQRLGEGFVPLAPNTRVRLRTTIEPLELRAATGTVVGPAEWEDFYVVRLDAPAIYHEADGGVHDVELVRAGVDILEPLKE